VSARSSSAGSCPPLPNQLGLTVQNCNRRCCHLDDLVFLARDDGDVDRCCGVVRPVHDDNRQYRAGELDVRLVAD